MVSHIYYARSDDALANGSFIHETVTTKQRFQVQYMNGDYMGEIAVFPADIFSGGWKRYDKKTAFSLIPRSMRY